MSTTTPDQPKQGSGMDARLRSLLTLGLLVVLLVGGLVYAWSSVTKPFPSATETIVCDNTEIAAGEKVYPDQVLVSVLNGSDRDGLASRTLEELSSRGFATGRQGNLDGDSDVKQAEIWADSRDNPAAKLLANYLGKKSKIVIREGTLPGINIVVGENFGGVGKRGKKSQTASTTTTICSPPATTTDDSTS